jgi:hypothetical protein
MSFRRTSKGVSALHLWCWGLVLANLPFFVLGVLTRSWVMCVTTAFTTMVCLAVAADARKTLGFRVFFCIGITMFWWVVSIVTLCVCVPARASSVFTQEIRRQQTARQTPTQSVDDGEPNTADDGPAAFP